MEGEVEEREKLNIMSNNKMRTWVNYVKFL